MRIRLRRVPGVRLSVVRGDHITGYAVPTYLRARNPLAGAFPVNAPTPAVLHPQGVASCGQP